MSDSISAIVITCHSAVGQQQFAALERAFGPCAADSGGAGLVWATHRAPTTVSRVFAATPTQAAVLGSGSIELAIGVTARIEPRHPSSVTYEGAGASFHALLQTNPGIRRQPFPDLPPGGGWVNAIARAARGERLLGSSPEVAAAAVQVARASGAGAAVSVTAPVEVAKPSGIRAFVPGKGWIWAKEWQ